MANCKLCGRFYSRGVHLLCDRPACPCDMAIHEATDSGASRFSFGNWLGLAVIFGALGWVYVIACAWETAKLLGALAWLILLTALHEALTAILWLLGSGGV